MTTFNLIRSGFDKLWQAANNATPGPWRSNGDIILTVGSSIASIISWNRGRDATYIAEASPDKIISLLNYTHQLENFARDIRDNWDCDADAHRYGTFCRCCEAAAVLDGTSATG